MIEAYYNWCHTIGLHLYDIPALVILVVMIIIGLVHWRNQKKRQKDFEDEMEKKQEQKATVETAQAEEAH